METKIEILQGNLLDSTADAIVLTIDGAAIGMEGNLARLFSRQCPDAWEDLEFEITYPIQLGNVKGFRIDEELDCNNKLIYIASTLHHIETLTDGQKINVIENAIHNIVNLSVRNRVKSIATAILSGGWRLSTTDALGSMIETYIRSSRSTSNPPVLYIYVLNQDEFEKIGLHLTNSGLHFRMPRVGVYKLY
ncbi:hypothetical protein MNBD_GAMMA12-1999 [hydrothermal vent metagenome]|uniref:Macro domain-containing protein n=1 Tax=hydrothermal vent metagenome TaxID=652676 RepID=A0A3B0Z2U1_9ZZZZ